MPSSPSVAARPEPQLQPVSPRAARALVAVLASVTAMGPLAMQIFLPALPSVQAEFGASTGAVQLTLSLSMVAIALSTLVYGPLSDRFGRRPVMLAGLALFLVGTLVCALAASLPVLVLGRIVQAAGGAAGMVLARAVVRDVHGPERAAGVIAQLTMIMVVAPMIAPAIGGVLTDAASWRAVFWFAAATAAVILLVVWRGLAESNPYRGTGGGALDLFRGFSLVLRSAPFCGYVAHTSFSSVIFFSFISGAPYLMVNVMGRPATDYGIWFVLISLAYMAGNYTAIRIGRRVAPITVMIVGSALGLLGVLAAVVVTLADALTPLTLFGSVAFALLGNGMAMPNAQAGAINVFPTRAGTASAFSGFAQMTVSALATQLVGVLQNGSAWPMLSCMLVGVSGAMVAILLVLVCERRGA